MRFVQISFVLIVFLACVVVAIAPPKVTFEMVMDNPPYPYSHVCSLTERMEDGVIVASFQSGSGEGHEDVKIYVSIRDGNGTTSSSPWSPIRVAAERKDWCVMNACQYQNPDGRIYLTFHSGSDFHKGTCSTHTWHGYYVYSDDGGYTWKVEIKELPKDCLGCIKNKCIKLSNGEVLCPSSTESILEFVGVWEGHMETTNDDFSSFKRRSNIQYFYSPETEKVCQGLIQPTLFETSPGNVLALMRSGCGVIVKAKSKDYGHSWPEFGDGHTGLPNPNAGIDGVVMEKANDIGLLLAFNNDTHHRTPLTLAHSVDDGETWEHILDVETDPSGTFAYPALIQSKFDPRVAHLCYTYHLGNNHTMRYARLEFP